MTHIHGDFVVFTSSSSSNAFRAGTILALLPGEYAQVRVVTLDGVTEVDIAGGTTAAVFDVVARATRAYSRELTSLRGALVRPERVESVRVSDAQSGLFSVALTIGGVRVPEALVLKHDGDASTLTDELLNELFPSER